MATEKHGKTAQAKDVAKDVKHTQHVTATQQRSATRTEGAKLARAGKRDAKEAGADLEAARGAEAARRVELAEGVSDLTRAEDLERVAGRVGELSEIVSAAGARDLAQGVEMLVASEDIKAMSAVVAVMGAEDLEQGLALARLSGELRAAYALVRRLHMPVLAAFLSDRSERLHYMAVETALRASSTRALGTALVATGQDLSELSAEEVAEGVTRLVASAALEERSGELEEESEIYAEVGVDELMDAQALGQAARGLASEGVEEAAVAGAELGAAAEARQTTTR
jgi:hypothetical protein